MAYARIACDYEHARDDLEILKEIANVASADFVSPINKRNHEEFCDNTKPWVDCGCPFILEKGVTKTSARYYGQKSIEDAGGWDGIISQQFEKNRGGYPKVRALGAQDLVSFVEKIPTESAVAGLDYIIDGCVLPWLAEQEGLSGSDLAENGKVEDFQLLVDMAEPDMSLEDFIKEIERISSADTAEKDSSSVIIGTFHWSKGAERSRVIVNLTRCPIVPPLPKQGELPTSRPPTMEEERRLAYVGVTRAKDEVYLATAGEWLDQPLEISPFIREILKSEK